MKRVIRSIGTFIILLLLPALSFAYAMFEGGFVSWFLFYSLTPIFLYEIGLFLYPINKWRVSRQFNHRVVSAGEELKVTIHIKRRIPFPLYYCMCEEIFPDSMNTVHMQHQTYRYLNTPDHLKVVRKMKRVFFPWFKRNMRLTYVLQEIPRGRHHFQSVRVRMSDMFGFIHKECIFHASDADELIAYPTPRPLNMNGRLSAFDQGEQSAFSYPSKSTNIATGTREYMPGDKFSWIDWKQTARKNELITKEFEQEKSTDTLVILNTCYHDAINTLAFEAAVETAYSVVEAIYKQSSKADFLSIGKESIYMSLHHNEMNTIRLREHLMNIEPVGKASFAKQLEAETLKIAGGFVIVLITTQLDEAFKTTVLQMGVRMKRIIVVFVQGSERIKDAEHARMRELQFNGVIINVLTEKELVHHTIGVNVT